MTIKKKSKINNIEKKKCKIENKNKMNDIEEKNKITWITIKW